MTTGIRRASTRARSSLGRAHGALADVEERAARLREAAFEVAKRSRRRRGNRQRHRPRSARLRPEIDGNVDDHRARFPGGAERVGFDQDLLDSIRRGDVDDALDERREDRSLIERLELESPVGRRGRLPQDVNERRRIEIRLRDAGQGVRESGTGNRDENARPTGGAGVAVRHEGGGELVRGHDRAHARCSESLEEGDVLRAGEPEDGVDGELLEGTAQPIGAVHRGDLPASPGATRRATRRRRLRTDWPVRASRTRADSGPSRSRPMWRSPPSWALKCVTGPSSASVRSFAAKPSSASRRKTFQRRNAVAPSFRCSASAAAAAVWVTGWSPSRTS